MILLTGSEPPSLSTLTSSNRTYLSWEVVSCMLATCYSHRSAQSLQPDYHTPRLASAVWSKLFPLAWARTSLSSEQPSRSSEYQLYVRGRKPWQEVFPNKLLIKSINQDTIGRYTIHPPEPLRKSS